MNGWKRIGIILSVLWITGGGIWTRGVVMREMGSSAKAQLHTCTTLHPNDTDPCFAKFDADWGRDVTDAGINTYNAIFTFVPLLLAWVLFYVVAGLTRWVIAGFGQG